MSKDLTLCVAVYNMQPWIARCLNSLFDKDDLDVADWLEVLVIDDGSTDNSAEIARRYAKCCPNCVRVIEKENGQYGSCVNRALSEASGRYFRMLDADDWMNTQALTQLLHLLHDQQVTADLLVTKFTRHSKVGKISFGDEPVSVEYGRTYRIEEMLGFSREAWPSGYVMHNMTMRTELLRQMNLHLTEGIYYTDTEYCFYPLYHLQTVMYIDLDLYQYDVTRDGQTTQLNVAYRNRHHLELLLKAMVGHFLAQREQHTEDFNRMARQLLSFLIKAFYMATCLGHRRDDGEDRKMLCQMDELLRQDDGLYHITTERRYNLLPYVQLVRRTGCWPSCGLWGAYNMTVDRVKKIAGLIDRKYE